MVPEIPPQQMPQRGAAREMTSRPRFQPYRREDSEDDSEDRRPGSSGKTVAGYKCIKITSDLKTLKSDFKNYGKNSVKLRKTKTISRTKKKVSTEIGQVSVSAVGFVDMIETYDRKSDADANVMYSGAGTYSMSGGKDESGKRLPKIGAFAHAGVAEAHAEASIFSAHARVLHAGAQADVSFNSLGVSAMATAELASASASAGPVSIKVGLAADTGVKVGAEGFEVQILGTGVAIGPKTSVSLLGSEVSCAIM